LLWSWRVATATYAGGAITLLSGSSLIVFWTVILFTPLLIATLLITKSRLIAAVGSPLIGASIIAAVLFWRSAPQGAPQSTLYFVTSFTGIVAPLILYVVVSRYLRRQLKAVA
jgi:hypothetical protein